VRTTSHKTAEPLLTKGKLTYGEVFMQELIKAAIPNIPNGLARIANGRDNLSTNEAAYATGAAPQTIRKHLCIHGHFHGVKPVRIGSRLYFKVADLAPLIRGDKS
jgi:hypothetical protein